MIENTKKVPKRRFKEFQNTGTWEQRKANDIAEFSKGNGYSKGDLSENGTPIILYGRLYTKYKFAIDDVDTFAEVKNCAVFSKGNEVIVPASGETAEDIARAAAVVKSGVLLGGDLNILRPYNYINPMFLALAISNGNPQKELAKKAQGKSVVHIHNSDIQEVNIHYPTRDEQDQIVNVFTHLDNLITLHQRKLEKMKSLKSAYLSEMFPKEGEREPKRRFAGFTGAWKQRKVKDICSISTGKSNTQDRIEDGVYPFYVRSSIIERSNRYFYDEEAVLTVGDGVGTGKVFHYVTGKYDLHQRVYRMFDFNSEVSGKYFYYYFSNHFYDRVMAMTAKTSVDSVRYEMISEMDIVFPCEEEQAAITKTFENLDNLITLHQRKLEKLQNIKKAYLNEMFI